MQFETSIVIEAELDETWEILTAVTRWPEWTPSVREVTLLEGTALGRGSRARVRQPGLLPLVWTVTEFAPHSRFSWSSSSLGATIVGTHRLTPGDDGVTATLGLELSGGLARVIATLMGRTMRRYVQMEADGLKYRAELSAGRGHDPASPSGDASLP
jgi:uncharacterized membrane protein